MMKGATGTYVPVQDDDNVGARCKVGAIIRCVVTLFRNYRFFKKWWAMVRFAYSHWDPVISGDWEVTPKKSFERFRKDVIILAGYYDQYFRVDGSVKMEAQSISWAKMSQEEFERLYSATVDVIMQHVLQGYDRVEAQRIADQLLLEYA